MSVDFTTLLRERRPASAIRGQSETTSVAIAVALVVVLVAAAGVFIFGDVTDSEDACHWRVSRAT
jgi:flagellin-like protein